MNQTIIISLVLLLFEMNAYASHNFEREINDSLCINQRLVSDTILSFFNDVFEERKPYLISKIAYSPYDNEQIQLSYFYIEERKLVFTSDSAILSAKNYYMSNSVFSFNPTHQEDYLLIYPEFGFNLVGNEINTWKSDLIQHYNEKPLVYEFRSFLDKELSIDFSNKCSLSGEYIVYVLKRGRHNILIDAKSKEFDVLPDFLKHGYSAGVAINAKEKHILYWIIAW